jgi:hypothetical protein
MASQKRVVTHSMHVEDRSTIRSLDELWQKSDIVIEGTIEAARPLDIPLTAGPPAIYTEFDVRVHEVYKPNPRVSTPGSLITTRRSGGERDRGDYLERWVPDHYPLFGVGERYILFLNEQVLDTGQVFYYEGGARDRVFQVTAAGLQTPAAKQFAREFAGRGVEVVRQVLRDRRGR